MRRAEKPRSPRRPLTIMLTGNLVEQARAEGLNLSALAETAVNAALNQRARARWDAEIAEACAAHDRYLEEYGSATDLIQEHFESDERRDASE